MIERCDERVQSYEEVADPFINTHRYPVLVNESTVQRTVQRFEAMTSVEDKAHSG